MNNSIHGNKDNNNNIEKQIARKMALRGLIAATIVFVLALSVFLVIKTLGSGRSDQMPIAQVKEDGEWTLVRELFSDKFPGVDVDINASGIEFIYNEELDTYDMIVHYKALSK